MNTIIMDHDYARKSPIAGNFTLNDVADNSLKEIFKRMNLTNRTKLERVCWRWGCIIPRMVHKNEFFPSRLDTCYIPPKSKVPLGLHIFDAYLPLLKKCNGLKRFTTEYFSSERLLALRSDRAFMVQFCEELATLRPDINELVIETRVSERWTPQRGLPINFAMEFIYQLNLKKSNNITSLILYTESWSYLNSNLLPFISTCLNAITSLTLIFTSKYPDDFATDHMSSCWIHLAPSLTKLQFIWNAAPVSYGFETVLHKLEELAFKPSPEQLLKSLKNMPHLTKLSFVGDLDLLQTLVHFADLATDLTQISWTDVDRKLDEDFRVFNDRTLFNQESNDRRNEAKNIFDSFFTKFGRRLKLLHLTVRQLNILCDDLLGNMVFCEETLTDIKLDFHRRCDISVVPVIEELTNLRKITLGFRNPIDHHGLKAILKSCPDMHRIDVGLLYEREGEEVDDEEEVEEEPDGPEFEPDDSSDDDVDMENVEEMESDEEMNEEPASPDVPIPALTKEDEIKTYAVDALCWYAQRTPRRYILAKLTAQFPFRNRFRQHFPKDIILEEEGVSDGRLVIDLLNPTESD